MSVVKKRVLVIERDPVILGLMSYLLERQSFQVDAVSSPEDALAMLGAENFDAVVLESDRNNLLSSIETIRPALIPRTVIVTGGRDGSQGKPVHAILRKPFEVTELAQAVAEAVRTRT